MLNEFVHWWARQMLDLLPASLRRTDAGTAEALVVSGDAAAVELAVRRRRTQPLGRFTLDPAGIAAMRAQLARKRLPGSTVLRLPGSALLQRRIALPLAAERSVARIVQYEMDRFTPFTAEEVFWTATVERADRAQGRVHVLVSLVPRAGLAPLLDALALAGVAPDALELTLPDQAVRRIGLAGTEVGGSRWRVRLLVAGAGLCALLAVAAVALPFVRQAQRGAAIDAKIAALRPTVAQAEALRARIASATTGADVVATEHARVGDAVQVLAALTDILPDDTFLTALTLRTRKLTMDGQSAAAARLIAALSSDPVIRNAAFAAPVTRNERSADVFSIRAELGP